MVKHASTWWTSQKWALETKPKWQGQSFHVISPRQPRGIYTSAAKEEAEQVPTKCNNIEKKVLLADTNTRGQKILQSAEYRAMTMRACWDRGGRPWPCSSWDLQQHADKLVPGLRRLNRFLHMKQGLASAVEHGGRGKPSPRHTAVRCSPQSARWRRFLAWARVRPRSSPPRSPACRPSRSRPPPSCIQVPSQAEREGGKEGGRWQIRTDTSEHRKRTTTAELGPRSHNLTDC